MASDTTPVPNIPLRFDPTTRTYHASAEYIHRMIMAAAERQIATAAVARPILAAGLGDALRDLVHQIAANAANPIADAIEEALTAGTDRVT
jgi:hypothetical protein